MFGLKGDWSLEVKDRYFTLDDYSGAEPRWCTGCGDHGILAAVHRVCRESQIPPEKTVAVSGIGCSSRLPHYMNTYGFHGLHGRALPVACGIKSRRPDLDVWVATGDGDCFSIGGGHWIHAMRYNMDITLLVFDNGIYGLTKKQTSPTTPLDVPTNTHPSGALLPPLNPLTVTLGITNISFVAQIVDWNAPLRHEVIKKAHEHKGTSFVRIAARSTWNRSVRRCRMNRQGCSCSRTRKAYKSMIQSRDCSRTRPNTIRLISRLRGLWRKTPVSCRWASSTTIPMHRGMTR